MNQLPTHIGGYQHIEPWAVTQDGDIFVRSGIPVGFATSQRVVGALESASGFNIYRPMPVAKQGDIDTSGWQAVAKGAGQTATPLPTDAKARKAVPIYSGFIKYFPRAIAAVAHLSQVGNDQHNPGQPLHWDRSKSGDELDALMRHLMEADAVDKDGVDHLCKVAWRAMAALEKRLEREADQK